MSEYYKRYRPKSLKTVCGQEGALASLQRFIDSKSIPHTLLFSGPSGCGKTTIARILKTALNCGDQDFIEINCADFKGIDMVRNIRRDSNLRPICGDARIWLIDEAHKLTNDAQNAFLKILEDTPGHTYFMLCTTDPAKLLHTIHTRATEVRLSALTHDALARVLNRVIEKESLSVSEDVRDEIIEASEGSARKALVILEQIAGLEGDKAQIQAIANTCLNKTLAFDLARLLVTNWNASWGDCCQLLRGLKDEDAESVRYVVLGYARACMVGGEGKPPPNPRLASRAFKVIDIFARNFYDSKQAGLAAACYEVVNTK